MTSPVVVQQSWIKKKKQKYYPGHTTTIFVSSKLFLIFMKKT